LGPSSKNQALDREARERQQQLEQARMDRLVDEVAERPKEQPLPEARRAKSSIGRIGHLLKPIALMP
jgi:hypothetical protein